jgi:DNA-directed RNA polymerase specialized sigma24 family protein
LAARQARPARRDRDRYRALFDDCFPQVYAFAWGYLRNRRRATDLIVEAFATVLPAEADSDAAQVKLAVLRETARLLAEMDSGDDKEALLVALVFGAALPLQEAAHVLQMPLAVARRSLIGRLRNLPR